MKLLLTLTALLLAPLAALHAADAMPLPLPAQTWQQMTPGEKLNFARGVIEGSQLGVESWERYLYGQNTALAAEPSWFSDPLLREGYKAKLEVGAREAERGRKRSVLAGKPESVSARLDAFYAEPLNARITHSLAVWVLQFLGEDLPQDNYVPDKLKAARAFANLQWIDQTGQRQTARPALQWDGKVGPGPFGRARRTDGGSEVYYSLDPYYAAALFMLAPKDEPMRLQRNSWGAAHWSHVQFRPLTEALRKDANALLARRESATGLVAEALKSKDAKRLGAKAPEKVHTLTGADDLLRDAATALADDAALLAACAEHLDAVWRHHFVTGKGLYRYVDVTTGQRLESFVRIQEYGKLGTRMAEMFRLTHEAKWRARVQELNELVWSRRRDPRRGFVPLVIDAEKAGVSFNVEAGIASEAASWTGDSDCIYYIRDVFEQWRLTDLALLKEIVLRHGSDFAQAAWLGDKAGHFSRNWWVDGRPLTSRMYGDGRFNTNYQLGMAAILAPDAAEKQKFLAMLDRQLATFQRLDSVGGMFGMQFLSNGKVAPEYGHAMDDFGICTSQEQYVAIHLVAWQASSERRYLDAAKAHMDRIILAGPAYWNPQNNHFPIVAVALADALARPMRFEIPLGGTGAELSLLQDGKSVFTTTVPAECAVVYLPPGRYEAVTKLGGKTQRQVLEATAQPASSFNP
jgi:hypothetical protein